MCEQKKPTVFISFNNKSSGFVDSLERKLSKVANVLRYEDKIPSWGSFTQFMDTLKEQDFAVLVVSDAYLKSYACMYEVLQAMASTNWKGKVLIALMPDAKPYLDDERVKYIEYWCNQYKDICEKLTSLPVGTASSLEEKRDMIKTVSSSIDQFLAFIADSNCPPIYDVIDEICERVQISIRSIFTYSTPNGEAMNIRQLLVMDYIRENPGTSVSQIAEGIGISTRSAQYHLQELVAKGKVEAKTRGKTRELHLV